MRLLLRSAGLKTLVQGKGWHGVSRACPNLQTEVYRLLMSSPIEFGLEAISTESALKTPLCHRFGFAANSTFALAPISRRTGPESGPFASTMLIDGRSKNQPRGLSQTTPLKRY